jgi:hypothetical protein
MILHYRLHLSLFECQRKIMYVVKRLLYSIFRECKKFITLVSIDVFKNAWYIIH